MQKKVDIDAIRNAIADGKLTNPAITQRTANLKALDEIVGLFAKASVAIENLSEAFISQDLKAESDTLNDIGKRLRFVAYDTIYLKFSLEPDND